MKIKTQNLKNYIVRADQQWDMGESNFWYSRIKAVTPKDAARIWCKENEEEAPLSVLAEVNDTIVYDVEDSWVLEVTEI